MLHSETASTASSESAFNKDHEEIPQFNTTSTVSTNERAAASPDPFVEDIETASASQRMFPPDAEEIPSECDGVDQASSSHELLSKKVTEELGVQASFLDQISGNSRQLEVSHTFFGKEPIAKSNQITLTYLKENVSLQPRVKVRGRPKYSSKLWPSKRRKKCDDSKTQKENNPPNPEQVMQTSSMLNQKGIL